MSTVATQLVKRIKQDPRSYFVSREEGNYDLFLALYEEVGYAPKDPRRRVEWRQRSRSTWKNQDSLMPGNCTGGSDRGRVVSSWGTLPKASNVLYGHSVCMMKTAASAATLFAQSLYSIDLMGRFTEINFWAGSYANRSRFTSLFQRPIEGKIPDQLELEVLRFGKSDQQLQDTEASLRAEPLTAPDLTLLPFGQDELFRLLSVPHQSFDKIHRIEPIALRDKSTGAVKCLVLSQAVPEEFTAANVFSWTWVFPTKGVVVDSRFVQEFRSVQGVGFTELQIVLSPQMNCAINDFAEPTVPSFWAFTPRHQLGSLRRSFEDAFTSLLERYSDEELESVGERGYIS